jgi:NADPH:quinone reductase
VDVIVDVAAHTNLAKDLKAVCKGGRIVIVGSRGDITVSPRDIMSRECIVTGVQLRLATPEGEIATVLC